MEGNITYILLKTKRLSSRGISFMCMIMEANLTNLCTRLEIFFLPPVAPIFPFQSGSHHKRTQNTILYCWTHFIMLLKCYKSIDVIRLESQTMKISHYIFVSKIILLSIFYFIIVVPLYSYYYAPRILSTH